jgi:hypothetical protein
MEYFFPATVWLEALAEPNHRVLTGVNELRLCHADYITVRRLQRKQWNFPVPESAGWRRKVTIHRFFSPTDRLMELAVLQCPKSQPCSPFSASIRNPGPPIRLSRSAHRDRTADCSTSSKNSLTASCFRIDRAICQATSSPSKCQKYHFHRRST